jgi:hypothetical protein
MFVAMVLHSASTAVQLRQRNLPQPRFGRRRAECWHYRRPGTCGGGRAVRIPSRKALGYWPRLRCCWPTPKARDRHLDRDAEPGRFCPDLACCCRPAVGGAAASQNDRVVSGRLTCARSPSVRRPDDPSLLPRRSVARRTEGVAVADLKLAGDGSVRSITVLESPDSEIAREVRTVPNSGAFPSRRGS